MDQQIHPAACLFAQEPGSSISCAMVVGDQSGRILYTNDEFCLLSGYRPEVVTTLNWKDVLPQEGGWILPETAPSTASASCYCVDCIRLQIPVDLTVLRLGPHVDSPLIFSVHPAQLAGGSIASLLVRAHDASPDGFAVFRPLRDKDGAILDFVWEYVNSAAVAIGQVPDPSGLVGRRLLEHNPGHRDSGLFEHYVDVMTSGKPKEVEFRYSHENIDAWFRNISVPIDDRLVMWYSDITAQKTAEAALAASESRFRRLAETSSVGFIIGYPDGKITFINPASSAMLGFTQQEVLEGKVRWDEITAAEYHDRDEEALRQLHENGTCLTYEKEFITRDGARIPVLMGAAVMDEPEPIAQAIAAFVTDLRPLREAQEELRKSQTRMRSLSESGIVGIIEAGVDGEILQANDAFLQMIGYSRQEYEEGHIRWNDLTPPEWSDADKAGLKELRRTGKCQPYEKEYIRKDGSRVPIIIGYATVEGASPEHICFILDLTERKQVEQELMYSRQSLELAQQAGHIGTFDWNLQTGVHTWTRELEEIYGFTEQGVVHDLENWGDCVHPEDREKADQAVAECLESGAFEGELRIIRQDDGQVRTILVCARIYRDGEGEPHRLVGVTMDVTDAREAVDVINRNQHSLAEAQRIANLGSWEMDVPTRALQWSDQAYRQFGLDPQSAPPTFDDLVQHIHPEDREHFLQQLQAALAGEDVPGVDFRILLADGDHRHLRSQWEVTFQDGQAVHIRGTSLDITERKHAEDALIESRRILQALMEHIPEGITIAEAPDGNIRMMSDHGLRLHGTTLEQMKGTAISAEGLKGQFLNPGGLVPVEDDKLPLRRAISSGEIITDEEWILAQPSGERIPLLFNAAPIRDDAGTITGGVSAWRDITVIKKAEDALKDALDREYALSRTLQRALISKVPEVPDKIKIESAYVPAYRETLVGGDFFDVFRPADGTLGIVIGDVTGKGVEAAVRTGTTKNTLRAFAYENPEPGLVLNRVNRVLCRELPEDTFVTLFYGLLDLESLHLTWVSAGHEPAVCIEPPYNSLSEVREYQPPLGVFEDYEYSAHGFALTPGMRVLLYTDGITEARATDSHALDFFGKKRLMDLLLRTGGEPSTQLLQNLVLAVQQFCKGEPRDDIAALLVCTEE